MNWFWKISGGCCLSCVGFVAFWYLLVGVMILRERHQTRKWRREFLDVEAFRVAEDGSLLIVQEGLEDRLNRIGAFTSTFVLGQREICWDAPAGLSPTFAPCQLMFVLEPDNVGPDETTFQLWHLFQEQHVEHFATFKSRVMELHHILNVDLPDDKVDEQLERIQIVVHQAGYGDSATHELEAHFEFEWEQEHDNFLPFDPETQTFGDWEGY